MENYIGLDAHSQTCTFVTLNNYGQEISQLQVATNEKELFEYLRALKGKKILTFEESSLAKWLYEKLKPEVDELLVCNPMLIAKKRGAKTDYLDAKHLARELRAGNLVAVYHDDQNELNKLRVQMNSYNDLVQDMTRTKNRLKAIFRAEARPAIGRTLFTSPERVKELSSAGRLSAEILFKQYDTQKSSKQIYIEAFEANIKKFPVLKRLTSLPGIDVVRANVIGITVCDGKRFANKHVFWSYCSLVRYDRISDGQSYGTQQTYGSKMLKEVFMGAATSILMGDSSLRKHYDQLRSKGLDARKGKKAIARKVAAIALTIMKTDVVYDDKFMEKLERKNKKKN